MTALLSNGVVKQPKPYQDVGADFLVGGGTLLADEPGLGKTLQAILACKRIGARRVLVACPAVALSVWRDEVRDCWPECTPFYLRDLVSTRAPREPFIIITGYEYLLVNGAAKQVIAGIVRFDALILDEAHALKNPAANRTMLVYGPGCGGGGLASMADRVWLLTGTPMLNHPGELFPHLRALAPDRIHERSYDGFTHHYCTRKIRTIHLKAKPGKKAATKNKEVIDGSNRPALSDLAKRMRGFWLKRRTEDVLGQVPTVQLVPRSLSPDACDGSILAGIEQSDEAKMLRKALESGSADALKDIEGQVSRIRRLLALAKVEATVGWVEDLLDQGVPKVTVWGLHVDALQRIAAGLTLAHPVIITGATPSRDREAAIRKFQTAPSCKVFIGQIQAAGTAIDLDVAKRAVFVEQAWTPALNHQAMMRHFRAAKGPGQLPALGEALAVDGSIDGAVQSILAKKAMDIMLLEHMQDGVVPTELKRYEHEEHIK